MTSHETEPAKTYPAQRIVGALVLLALAVIIIPMVLDFRKGYDVTIDKTNIPPKPDDLRVEILPLIEDSGPVAPQPSVPSIQAQANEAAPPETPAPSESAPISDADESGAKPQQAAAGRRPPAMQAAEKRNEEKPMVQTARGAKPPPSPVSAPRPKPKPVVAPAPPKPPPVTASLPPPSAWVLQVGNFSSRKNAHALRERLRRNGFRAFVDEKVRNGARTYRVFVGPELVKINTDILKRELKEDMNLNGIVIPYER